MKDFFTSIFPVDEEILDNYLAEWKEIEFPKKHIITSAGEVENNMYYVVDGVQKSYYQDEKKAHIMAFTYPPSFTGIPESFFTREPSRFFLETVTDSKLMKITFDRHQEFLLSHPGIETLFRKATEYLLAGMVERHLELMANDMESRFRNFVKRSPHLLHLVSHKDIASYLRIDPTNFSKLMGSVKI